VGFLLAGLTVAIGRCTPPDQSVPAGRPDPDLPATQAGDEVARLIRIVEDGSSPGLDRMDAAAELADLGDSRAVPALLAVLEEDMNRRTGVWAAAIPALGTLRDPRAVPALIEALELREEDWLGREMAAVALGEIGDEAAVPALLHAASMVDTRAQAICALAAIGDPRAAPLFVEVLAGGDEQHVVDTAERALVELGPDAVPALQEADDDPRPAVRNAVRTLLNAIETTEMER
jgi:HEAT repeat protein